MTSQTFCLEDAKRPAQNTQYMAWLLLVI